jgi:hypothetical protein
MPGFKLSSQYELGMQHTERNNNKKMHINFLLEHLKGCKHGVHGIILLKLAF